MKLILGYSFASVLLLAGAPAAADDFFTLADKIIREHHLLTPEQIRCMTLIERDDSSANVAKVGVYERHDEKCGGDPEITHRLFDLEIDRENGVAKWDNNFPDMEMRPVPGPAPTAQAEPQPEPTMPVWPSPKQPPASTATPRVLSGARLARDGASAILSRKCRWRKLSCTGRDGASRSPRCDARIRGARSSAVRHIQGHHHTRLRRVGLRRRRATSTWRPNHQMAEDDLQRRREPSCGSAIAKRPGRSMAAEGLCSVPNGCRMGELARKIWRPSGSLR